VENKYILIVEDSSAQAMASCYLLENKGVEILWARNGWEGIDLAIQYAPKAIILDVQMPEIDGFEVCRRLKADPRTAQIPVIMYTSRDYAPDLMYGLELGAIDYIPKDSFSGTVLLATLRELGVFDPDGNDNHAPC
jgi:DNA-binding response OmpR family regulator